MKKLSIFCVTIAIAILPLAAQDYLATLTSWYGPGFHGRTTASMEIYDENAMTCAHPTLPFNTRILIVNLENGRSAIARVNDRGPYYYDPIYQRPRGLDVSFAVAQHLMMVEKGIAETLVRPLDVMRGIK